MKILSFLIIASSLALSGCKGEDEAFKYAQGLMDVLQNYGQELEAKSAGEQKAYKTLGRIYGEAADSDLLASLSNERHERGDRLADLAIAGKTPTATAIKDTLKEYAIRDSEATHELLTRESNNYDKYLSTLNKLAVDGDAIDAASQALDALTKKPSLLQKLSFWKDYAISAKGCLSESICKDLSNQLATAQGNLEDESKVLSDQPQEKNRKGALKGTIASLTARQKSAGCNANPKCATGDGGKPDSK